MQVTYTQQDLEMTIVTDFRLWIRKSIEEIDIELVKLKKIILKKQKKILKLFFLAILICKLLNLLDLAITCSYLEMFGRDSERFQQAKERLNECPLGSAALAELPFLLIDFTLRKY